LFSTAEIITKICNSDSGRTYDDHYEEVFDEFEYLWCLLYVDAKQQHDSVSISIPYGSFEWRMVARGNTKIITANDKNWVPLAEGLFGKDLARLKKSFEYASPELKKISQKLSWV
jgi:hypothetical protein